MNTNNVIIVTPTYIKNIHKQTKGNFMNHCSLLLDFTISGLPRRPQHGLKYHHVFLNVDSTTTTSFIIYNLWTSKISCLLKPIDIWPIVYSNLDLSLNYIQWACVNFTAMIRGCRQKGTKYNRFVYLILNIGWEKGKELNFES